MFNVVQADQADPGRRGNAPVPEPGSTIDYRIDLYNVAISLGIEPVRDAAKK
jgi:hypothetical protein